MLPVFIHPSRSVGYPIPGHQCWPCEGDQKGSAQSFVIYRNLVANRSLYLYLTGFCDTGSWRLGLNVRYLARRCARSLLCTYASLHPYINISIIDRQWMNNTSVLIH